MSRLVARLILAMLLLPITGAILLLFFILFVANNGPPGIEALLAMWAFTYVVIGGYWLTLWRDQVRWTPPRVMWSWLLIPIALAVAAAAGVFIGSIVREPEVGVLIGGGVAPIVGVLGSVLIWRETPAERLERLAAAGRDTVACPICGYNLTGLREARCPECGGQFTLEELLFAQRGRETQELEQG
jgi:hypothetical protein